jgi:RNA polymerase sigma-70 factor (ECF subfamily)
LIKVARHQDQHAFQQLFNYFAPKVKSFYMKHRLSESVSEELMQETFISVWKFANYFEANKGQVSTWLFTIARNKELDYYRKNGRQVPTSELVSEDMAIDSGEQYQTQLHREMGELIPQLPEEQQQVLQKVYFEELSHQKAADALNLTLGTVKGRLRSAINNLNKLMRGVQ